MKENSNLTVEQHQLMQVNAIVALLRSHQFDKARVQWQATIKDNNHKALKGIGAYFYLKDKQYEKALELVAESHDDYSVFTRSHILLSMKEPSKALLNLMQEITASLLENESYVTFLLKAAIAQKLAYFTV